VPANPKAKLKPLVRLKAHESCHALKRHFEDGVLREVVGAWENQLRKYPNDKNFLWVDVPWTVSHTVKGHEKNVDFKSRVSHSRWMVEGAYLAARELGIVSRPFETEIEGHGVKRGFVLTPHNALCRRTKVGCLFVGPCKIPGTSWRTEMLFSDGKPSGKKSIIFTGFMEKGEEEGKERGKERGKEQGKDEGKDEGKENRLTSGQGNSHIETSDSSADSGKSEAIPQRHSLHSFDSCESVHSPHSCKTYESTGDYGDAKGKQEQVKSEVKRVEQSLTHSNLHPNPDSVAETVSALGGRPVPEQVTVRQHFENCDDAVLLVTDGVLPIPEQLTPDRDMPFQHVKQNELHAALWLMNSYVMEAVREYGDTPLTNRKLLAGIMNRAIAIAAKSGKKAPKAFFKVMKDFQEHGGRITLIRKEPEPEKPKEKWSQEWLQSQGINSFRDAWQKFAADPDVPRELLDEWYNRDAAPDKPSAPWR
jgi:hypothetical protein